MAKILWLDDQDWEVAHFCDALRTAGHTVELTDSEDDVRVAAVAFLFKQVRLEDSRQVKGQT